MAGLHSKSWTKVLPCWIGLIKEFIGSLVGMNAQDVVRECKDRSKSGCRA